MKIKALFVVVLMALAMLSCENNSEPSDNMISIIPEPNEVTLGKGRFEINQNTKILVQRSNEQARPIAQLLVDKFKKVSGWSLLISEADEVEQNSIFFTLADADASLNDEGYEVNVDDEGVVIKATHAAGLFYGLQTLYALLPPEVDSQVVVSNVTWQLPSVQIKDEPRFKWRGVHLDVSRHFMPVDFIKKYLDYMAMHKLNTFHWHLTDDQGWRIEIKQYPKLTDIGAWRKETLIGYPGENPPRYDGKRYGGFYSQEEIKELVKYAQDRFITIVPEIEMPGHSSAAIAAYPTLGVTGKQIDVVTSWGVFPDIYNVEEATFLFLENVLTEVMALFPSEYIHIGGDEAWKEQWETSPRIQKKIKQLGLKDEHELQSYFITRIEKFLNSKGRQIIGWDEILEGGLAPNAAVMSWRGEAGGVAAAKSKHKVVMTPESPMYFNYNQANLEFEPMAFGGVFMSLEKVYSYEPIPEELSNEESQYVMGAQANLWTEYIPNPSQAEYMLLPRACALAELVWSQKEDRDWNNFKNKLSAQFERFDNMGIHYSRSIYKVNYDEQYDSLSEKLTIKLFNQIGSGDIHYSVNGGDLEIYQNPIEVDTEMEIEAATFKDGKQYSEFTKKIFKP